MGARGNRSFKAEAPFEWPREKVGQTTFGPESEKGLHPKGKEIIAGVGCIEVWPIVDHA
jgi:hypothetical protein